MKHDLIKLKKDRLLKQLPLSERRRQEYIRLMIVTDPIFKTI